jgi:lipopolysaccharide transport system ATP-binding protein
MSSDDVVISVENLSKSYLIGHQAAGQESFREMLGRRLKGFARSARDMAAGRQMVQGDQVEEFWALDDVSFEVKCGEVLGVIGRNGAGKSTLLKVLSRITEPTRGRVTIRGRVASLLEVGTGFHPELSGRENIFLNGAILGMSRAEIRARFDEIVDFAEVERFIDTPVKRYSSGMYVRLAFAVAAHMEPEILIVDEVLAVGDIAFQRKCLEKMQNVAQHGRTVIFVSHNLPAVVVLTQRAMLIDAGRILTIGPTREVVSVYLKSAQRKLQSSKDFASYRKSERIEQYVDITSVTVAETELGESPVIEFGSSIVIDVDLSVKRPVKEGIIVINVLNEQLQPITTLVSSDSGFYFTLDTGHHAIRCNAGALPLVPGEYCLSVGTAQAGGGLAWDVLEALPGFRIDGHQNAAWLQYPSRPGTLLFDRCEWTNCDAHTGRIINN